MSGQVDRDDLGAWLVRCNPRVWDLEQYWEDTDAPIDSWSVGTSYRTSMMQPGDRILLWVGGQSRRYERGIWGDGSVTGEPFSVDAGSEQVSPYWRSAEIGAGHQNFCPVQITPLLDSAVTDRRLRGAGITDLEVQRLPQGISPSWVTRSQLAQIDKIMAEQPDPVVTAARSGGGTPATPSMAQRVERAAMDAVTAYYEDAEWAVEDVSKLKLGWDLTCTKGRRIARVEVKGLQGWRPIIFLTRNEVRAARQEPDWYLAVVTRALEEPTLEEYAAEAAIQSARATLYRANLEPRDG